MQYASPAAKTAVSFRNNIYFESFTCGARNTEWKQLTWLSLHCYTVAVLVKWLNDYIDKVELALQKGSKRS